jgi:GTPase involved in cell partitioning and DNA repair
LDSATRRRPVQFIPPVAGGAGGANSVARKNERQVVTCRGGPAGGKRGANVSTVVTVAAHVFLPGKSRVMYENYEQGMKYSRAPFPRFIGKLCAPRHL